MSNVAQKIFEKNNISVDVKTGLSEDEIIKIIPEYDGLVVRSATKVTKNIIEAAKNLKIVEDWVEKSDNFKFMCEDKKIRSSTSITVQVKDEWFTKHNEEDQRGVLKKLFSLLEKEGVANDINGYPKAPPSIRIWGGSTVQNSDMKALLPWIDWAYNSIKNNA